MDCEEEKAHSAVKMITLKFCTIFALEKKLNTLDI